MTTEPFGLRTAEAWLAYPGCTHIITMNNPNQNLHLERLANGLRFTAGSPGAARHVSREFASLASFYEYWDEMPSAAPDLRGAIWQDITDYPVFTDDVLYLPLDGSIELIVPQDSEQITAHGPHTIYGPAEISATAPDAYRISATAGWLVIAHPACTFRGGVRGVLRPTRNMLDRLRLKRENYRLRREEAPPAVRPGATVVYGKPPEDWRALSQSLSADHPLPTV
ncbi:MAG TPA: hypothetical protein VFW76_07440 [Ktedonobacterales bacterium]|nr:hypothetical protein [Ktedonobacterales bacterium]